MAVKDKIYPGDTYLVSFEARKTNPDSPHDSHGLPATVVDAEVTLLDGLTGDFIPLGGGLTLPADAQIVPPTGVTSADTGSIVSYLLESQYTLTPGDFVLFVQCVFDNGAVLTEDRRLKVNEYR